MGQTAVVRRPGRTTIIAVVLALTAAILATTEITNPQAAEASHFRSTQLTWNVVDIDGDDVTVEFRSTFGARQSYPTYGDPDVGDTVTEPTINFGDGSSTQPPHTVVTVDSANDWMLAEAVIEHTYDTSDESTFTAHWQMCCRLQAHNGHLNNSNAQNRIETFLDLSRATASPVSAISPIVDCPLDDVCTFQVPSFDPEGFDRTFRMATGSEATGSSFTQPGDPHADNDAMIDPNSGIYSWDTTGADLASSGPTYYSTQVVIEKRDSAGDVVATTAVDFFIRLGEVDGNQPPTFTSPTPADGTTYRIVRGVEFSFDVAAVDPDEEDTVTLGMLGRPADAMYESEPDNPVEGTFTWTPWELGTTFLVLTASDQFGFGATQRTVTIQVVDIDEIVLEPLTTEREIDTDHTVTATALDDQGNPVKNAPIAFEVVVGPHAGTTGDGITDGDGQTTFTYTGTDMGIDTVVATFSAPEPPAADDNGDMHTASHDGGTEGASADGAEDVVSNDAVVQWTDTGVADATDEDEDDEAGPAQPVDAQPTFTG